MSVFIPSGTEDPIPEEDGVVKMNMQYALLLKMIRWMDSSCVNALLRLKKNGRPQRVKC